MSEGGGAGGFTWSFWKFMSFQANVRIKVHQSLGNVVAVIYQHCFPLIKMLIFFFFFFFVKTLSLSPFGIKQLIKKKKITKK